MKVVLASTRNVLATGVDRYASELAAALGALGISVHHRPVQRRALRLAGREVGGLASLWLERLRSAPRGVDVAHALDAGVASRGADVVTVHDLLPEQDPGTNLQTAAARIDWALSRATARRVPWIITPSEATRQEIVRRWGVDASRVVAIHHGIDHARFHPTDARSRHLTSDGPNVVYAGDDNPRKNLGLLVAGMAALRETHGIQARLVRVGPSRFPHVHEAYRKFAAQNGVDLVEPGYVDDTELAALYAGADAFAWPTRAEGFGFPPLEAMACGAPVVALDTPVNREVAGRAARYHADDPRSLADALAEVLAKRPSREEVLAHARTFTWERCARETLAVYERVQVRP